MHICSHIFFFLFGTTPPCVGSRSKTVARLQSDERWLTLADCARSLCSSAGLSRCKWFHLLFTALRTSTDRSIRRPPCQGESLCRFSKRLSSGGVPPLLQSLQSIVGSIDWLPRAPFPQSAGPSIRLVPATDRAPNEVPPLVHHKHMAVRILRIDGLRSTSDCNLGRIELHPCWCLSFASEPPSGLVFECGCL